MPPLERIHGNLPTLVKDIQISKIEGELVW